MKHKGFTMIEVLVALVIVSVGLLGMAGLIAEAQKSVLETQQRASALHLANDIIARMTANSSGLASYDGDVASVPTTPALLCNASGANCTPAQVAAFDLWQWSGNLVGATSQNSSDAAIGGLLAPVACIGINDNQVSLAIAWRGKFARPDGHSANICGDDDSDFKSDTVKNDLRRMLIISTRINS